MRKLNKCQLAREMKCSRTVIMKHLKKPGAPDPDAAGCYDPEAVKIFITGERKQDCRNQTGDLLKAKIEKLQLECRELRQKIKADEPSIPKSEIREMLWRVLDQIHIYLLAITRSASSDMLNITTDIEMIHRWEPRIMEMENVLKDWIKRQENLPMGENPFPVEWPLEEAPTYYIYKNWMLSAREHCKQRAAAEVENAK